MWRCTKSRCQRWLGRTDATLTKRRADAPQRIGLGRVCFEQFVQHERFFGSDAHALPVDWIEATDRVAQRQQPDGKLSQSLVVAVAALQEAVARDLAQPLRAAKRVRDRGRTQRLERGRKPRAVSGRSVVPAAADRRDPTLPFQRRQQTGPRMLAPAGKRATGLPIP